MTKEKQNKELAKSSIRDLKKQVGSRKTVELLLPLAVDATDSELFVQLIRFAAENLENHLDSRETIDILSTIISEIEENEMREERGYYYVEDVNEY